jgi:hypothetical protein
VRFVVVPPANTAFSPSSASLALSPDGRMLALTGSASQGELGLWVQPLDSLQAKRVAVAGHSTVCNYAHSEEQLSVRITDDLSLAAQLQFVRRSNFIASIDEEEIQC